MDPNLGLFLSSDAFEGIAEDPTTLHPFSYARQNPVVFSDASGMFSAGIAEASATTNLSSNSASLNNAWSARTVLASKAPATSQPEAARIVVDLGVNTLVVQDKGGNIIFGPRSIVHGCEGFDTPTGEFRAGDWQKDKTNPKFGPVPWSRDHTNPYGPWFLPIFDRAGGYTTLGIHGTAGPGWNPLVAPPFASLWGEFAGCSHGCIRLSNPSIQALHDLIPKSRRLPIIIRRSD